MHPIRFQNDRLKERYEPSRRHMDQEVELPTTMDGPVIDPVAAKTQARRDFERCPTAYLRRASNSILESMRLELDWASRPVDAGWQIACTQVHRGFSVETIESNVWIERAHDYLSGLLDCPDDHSREKLADRSPDVHAAYTLYRTADKFIRGRLEGHLLANTPFEEVAAACVLPITVVEAYERLFFRVHGQRDSRSYLRFHAFEGEAWEDMTEDDVDTLLKRAGYHGRPVLESMIRYYSSHWRIPDHLDGYGRDQIVELCRMLESRLLILSWVLPPSKIHRAERMSELLDELKKVIKGWPVGANAPRMSPLGRPLVSMDQLDVWWDSWRKTIDLASRNPPQVHARIKTVA